MTAIAYRDGVMAADTLDNSGGIVTGYMRKIVRRRDGALAGAAGDAGWCEKLLAAFLADKLGEFVPSGDKDNPYAAIVVNSDGSVHRVTEAGQHKMCDAPFYTEGCAYQVLTGALAMGASAEQAVRVAIQWDTRCGGEVTVERLG